MKRTLIALAVLIGLAALAYFLKEKRTGTTVSKELIGFAIADTASISRIFIAKQNGSTIDLNRAEGHWTVNNKYKAKQVNVNLLLKCFRRVEIRGPVPKNTQQTVIKNMSAKATKVEIYTGGSVPEKIWYIGSSTADHFGTYMLLETPENGRSSVPFEMGMSGFTGFLTPRFHTELEDWRNSELIAVRNLRDIASYEVKNSFFPDESFRVEVGTDGGFSLYDAEGNATMSLDTLAVSSTLVPLKKLHYEFFETYFNEQQRDSVLQSEPMYEVAITLRDGTSQDIRYWKRKPPSATYSDDGTELPIDPDRMFSVVNDSELIVLQRHLFDRTLPRLSDLR